MPAPVNKWQRLRCDEAGATMIEATFAVPFLLLFILCTSQLVLLLYDAVSIEYVLDRSSRDIAAIGVGGANPQIRAGAIQQTISQRAGELGVTLPVDRITVCPIGAASKLSGTDKYACSPNNAGQVDNNAGQANDLILVNVNSSRDLLFLGRYPISSQVMVRNEPFR